jgi:hypothetical protein
MKILRSKDRGIFLSPWAPAAPLRPLRSLAPLPGLPPRTPAPLAAAQPLSGLRCCSLPLRCARPVGPRSAPLLRSRSAASLASFLGSSGSSASAAPSAAPASLRQPRELVQWWPPPQAPGAAPRGPGPFRFALGPTRAAVPVSGKPPSGTQVVCGAGGGVAACPRSGAGALSGGRGDPRPRTPPPFSASPGLMPAGPLRGLPGPPRRACAARIAPSGHPPGFSARPPAGLRPRGPALSPAAPGVPLRSLRAPAALALVALALSVVPRGHSVGRRVPPARPLRASWGACSGPRGQGARCFWQRPPFLGRCPRGLFLLACTPAPLAVFQPSRSLLLLWWSVASPLRPPAPPPPLGAPGGPRLVFPDGHLAAAPVVAFGLLLRLPFPGAVAAPAGPLAGSGCGLLGQVTFPKNVNLISDKNSGRVFSTSAIALSG